MNVDIDTAKGRIRYLYEKVPDIAKDTDRGRLLMILLYWRIFDGVNIPESVMREILKKASNPESLGRLARFVVRDMARDTGLKYLNPDNE